MGKGIIISVINNKGGVGKTTATCNLGHALSKLEKRVLVVDIDSQCNATSLLFAKDMSAYHSLYELFNPDSPNTLIENCIYPTPYANLYCLPNVEETAGLEPDLIHNSPESFFILRRKLREHVLERFDFTFIDNPPNMGTFVICSLYASDFIIVPNESGSAFSMEGLVKAIRLIENIRENGNPDLRFLRLLINRVDGRTVASKATIAHIYNHFGSDQVFKTTIPSSTAFQRAEGMRQTIFRYAPSLPGAKAYRKLAEELIDILNKEK